MTRLNQLHGGVNLSQGFPDFPAPAAIKDAACAAISADVNQYAVTWGARPLREAIAREFTRRYGVAGRRRRAGHGLLRRDRGDDGDDDGDHRSRRRGRRLRAVLRELRPGRDPVGRDAALRHAARAGLDASIPTSSRRRSTTRRRRSSSTRRTTRPARCSRARSSRRSPRSAASGTRSRSPTRSTSTSSTTAARTCRSRRIDGMAERTVTINGLSKTYSVTGWRVGWTISPPSLTGAIRKVHDFLTVGAAGAAAGGGRRRARRCRTSTTPSSRPTTSGGATCCSTILERHHFTCYKPYGAYYIMTDISAFGFADDVEFARYLVKDVGVAAVPGSSFYKTPAQGGRSCGSVSASGTRRCRRPTGGCESWCRPVRHCTEQSSSRHEVAEAQSAIPYSSP